MNDPVFLIISINKIKNKKQIIVVILKDANL